MQEALLGVDDAPVHARDKSLIFGCFRPVGRRIFELYLRAVEEEVQLLRRVVLNLLVEVEKSAVGIAYPPPSPLSESDVVDGVLIVEALVEVHELVDVQLPDLAESRTARAASLRVVEAEGVGIADKRLAHP